MPQFLKQISSVTVVCRVYCRILTTAVLICTLAACGGGGGGSGTGTGAAPVQPTTLSYSGNLLAASLSAVNADTFLANVLDTGGTAGMVAPAALDDGVASAVNIPINAAATTQLLSQLVPEMIQRSGTIVRSSQVTIASIPVNVNEACDSNQGTLAVSGTLSDAGTGTLQASFNNCLLDGDRVNGAMTLNVASFDLSWFLMTDVTISFNQITVAGHGSTIALGGSMRVQSDIPANTERLTANLVIHDTLTGRQLKTENFVLLTRYDNLIYPTNYSLSIQGRLYDSVEGYVDLSTSSPMLYANIIDLYPYTGGTLTLTGANGSSLRLTPIDGVTSRIEIDTDGDAAYELHSVKPWWAISTPATGTNRAPTANAGSNVNASKGSLLQLDGSASSDADYDYISYSWQISQAPVSSSALLIGSNTRKPSFTPDLAGTYVLSLTVRDGSSVSTAAVVTLTILNDAPIANAGIDTHAVVGNNITLNGAASADANGDSLLYSWAWIRRPAGSSSNLINASTATPWFSPDVPGIYEISLTVNDGAISSAANITRIAARSANSLACTQDDVSSRPASGFVDIGPSTSFVPLCDGWILVGDRSTNRVNQLNIFTGQIAASYQLNSAPGAMALDEDNGLLYVGMSPATGLVKIDITTRTQTIISVSEPVLSIAIGNDGWIFAMTGDNYQRSLILIDGRLETVEGLLASGTNWSELIAYDREGDNVVLGDRDLSPTTLRRYSFDSNSRTTTLSEELRTDGGSGIELHVSPNGRHVLYPNGGGNGLGYSLYDYSTDNFNTVYGVWQVGAYPASANFDSQGSRIIATNTTSVIIYDVDSHVERTRYALNTLSCAYGRVLKVDLSGGDKIGYAIGDCTTSSPQTRSRLWWYIID